MLPRTDPRPLARAARARALAAGALVLACWQCSRPDTHACQQDEDCDPGRFCVAEICQSQRPAPAADGSADASADGSADASADGVSLDGGVVDLAADQAVAQDRPDLDLAFDLSAPPPDLREDTAATPPPPDAAPVDAPAADRGEVGPSTANYIFVTSTTFSLPFADGPATADAHCNSLAATARLPGSFIALSASAGARLAGARGWVRRDDRPVLDVATVDHILYPPELDEQGAPVGPEPVLVGDPGRDCQGLKSTAGLFLKGDPTGGHTEWVSTYKTAPCNQPFRLYCLGTDRVAPLSVPKAPGRMAFLTDSTWTPSGGRAAADARCQAEANEAKLTGTFKALLAGVGEAAAGRFNAGPADSPWVRPDGIPLAATAAELFRAGGKLTSAPQVTLARQYYGTSFWAGATDPRSPGTMATTCNDWGSGAGTATAAIGRTPHSRVDQVFGSEPAIPCDSLYVHLYCLQE
jgi:hypothetical protein